jgi:uncharacterized protein (TIGR02271 family)
MDLYSHYGLPYGARSTSVSTSTGTAAGRVEPAIPGAAAVGTGTGAGADDADAPPGRDASDPTSDGAMTRSEERLRVRTETEAVGRVRLRKHIVTEYEQVTVPVRREVLRLDREAVGGPGSGAGAEVDSAAGSAVGEAVSGPISEGEEHEIVLHAERPVVRTETVPVERVRMGKQTVTEQQQVDGQARKEQIELDTDTDTDPGRHDPR